MGNQLGYQTRKSVLAVKKEVTEGIAVWPAADTDYIALQEGFTFAPAFEELTSAELVGSIGQSKSVLGFENPEASISHYMRGSGVEAQAPNYNLFVEAAFGAVVAAGTERDTVVGSTTLLIEVDTGEGVEFERGKALLVKDAAGYSIRNVLSVTGDQLALGQALDSAPGTGVDLGRAILYKPADETHPCLTLTDFRGNGAAIEQVTGARVTEMVMTAEAGQFINVDYTLAGINYKFNPIELTASDNVLDWTDDSGTYAVTLEAKTYKDPHDLVDALSSAMNALSTETLTVVYNDKGTDKGKIEIASSTSAVLSLLWNTGVNTANTIGEKLGFDVSADDTGAVTYTSDSEQDWGAPHTPNFDDAQPLVAKNNEVMIGDVDDTECFGAQSVTATVSDTKTDIPDLCEESGRSGSIISAREVTIEVLALLTQHDADKFRRFREGSNTSFTYNAGEKSGGNWVAGKCINFYTPSATITSFEVTDTDGLVTVSMSLRGYVADGLGEAYLNYL